MSDKLACVVTTIQQPTPAIRRLSQRLAAIDAELIVVGDQKGPASFNLPGARFIPLAEQLDLPFTLARLLPRNHYVRKNLGYLLAIASGAACIYETDDDNTPLEFWSPRPLQASAASIATPGWFNVYSCFTDQLIWPRGFPLRHCRVGSAHRFPPREDGARREGEAPSQPRILADFNSPIQQSLANIAPDVDAVWRLAIGQEPFHFTPGPSVHLAPGTWCPFNSHATWWFKAAFPLMYLPSTCTFRMTDIWRSFIAQRCLWELAQGVTFHPPEVEQHRNPHDLMKDFEDEVPGYLKNESIARTLSQTPLNSGPQHVTANLVRCYEALTAQAVFQQTEMQLLRAWLADLERLGFAAPSR